MNGERLDPGGRELKRHMPTRDADAADSALPLPATAPPILPPPPPLIIIHHSTSR